MATVLEVPPVRQLELYESHQIEESLIYVYSHMQFRDDRVKIDLKKPLFGKAYLVAGELKLL